MEILLADDDIVIIKKDAGILSQPDRSGKEDSIPDRLNADGMAVKPVHRLDRDTGGVMVYARSDRAAAVLSATLAQHDRFCKEYLAVVNGVPVPLSATLEDWLYHDARKNKSFTVKKQRRGVRYASLSYTVLGTVMNEDKPLSLVLVRLHTGRTHQIRVQFSSRQMPLVGDSRYGGQRGCPLALWSYSLSFPHPITQRPICATCLPDTDTFPWNMVKEFLPTADE